jgi:hypothetical protein
MKSKSYLFLLTFYLLFSHNNLVLSQTELLGDFEKKYISEVVMISMIAYQNLLLKEQNSLSVKEIESKNEFILKYYRNSNWRVIELDSFLEKDWSRTKKEIFIPLINVTKEDDFTFEKLLEFKFNDSKTDFFNIRFDLVKEEYGKFLPNINSIQEVVDNTGNLSKKNRLVRLPDLINWLLIILGFIFLSYLLIKHKAVKSFISTRFSKISNQEKNQIKNYQSENILNDSIEKNKEEETTEVLSEGIDILPDSQIKSEENLFVENLQSTYQVPEISPPETLYFSGFQGNCFLKLYAKYDKDYSTIYIIRHQDNDDMGSLELVTENSSKIIANREIYIPPSICEIKFEEGSRKELIVTENGTVRNMGDRWEVQDKIKVVIR